MRVINGIKEALNVGFDYPAILPVSRPLLEFLERIVSAALSPKSIRVRMEIHLVNGFKNHRDCSLRNLVGKRWNSDRSGSSVAFGYVHSSHGWRLVVAGVQLLGKSSEIFFEVLAKLFCILPVYPSRRVPLDLGSPVSLVLRMSPTSASVIPLQLFTRCGISKKKEKHRRSPRFMEDPIVSMPCSWTPEKLQVLSY